jgi:hypothetical protein
VAKQTINQNPQVLDLVLYAGDGLSFSLVVTNASSAPVNLDGTMQAQIRAARVDPDPPLAIFDIDLAGAAEGIAVLSLTGEQTQALSDGSPPEEKFIGVWDVEWTAVGAEPVTLCQGKVECLPDVSH